MNITEELNLVEQQIHTLNLAQKAYPAEGRKLTLTISDPKKCYEYEVSDAWLDIYLDSIILHQSLVDDWKCKVEMDGETIFDTNITHSCFDKIKRVLDEAEDLQ